MFVKYVDTLSPNCSRPKANSDSSSSKGSNESKHVNVDNATIQDLRSLMKKAIKRLSVLEEKNDYDSLAKRN